MTQRSKARQKQFWAIYQEPCVDRPPAQAAGLQLSVRGLCALRAVK